MSAPTAVGVLTTVGRNVGDEFIREGVRAVLDALGAPYHLLYVDKHDPVSLHEPRYDETAFVEDKYVQSDVFIQCGAPVYWHLSGGKARSVDSEWHDWFWQRRALNAAITSHPTFLNLGAGSCQPWDDNGAAFVDDPECAAFARQVSARSALTIVRDPVAARIVRELGAEPIELPCPAFLAGARHEPGRAGSGVIGVNFMPKAGHFELDPELAEVRWQEEAIRLAEGLRQIGPLLFIAHDESEARFQARMVQGRERVYLAQHWQEYLDVYATCAVVAANRVHGAVCAASFGVPALIIGNDTRALIGESIGLPIVRAATMRADEVVCIASELLRGRDKERERLLELRKSCLANYVSLLRKAGEWERTKGVSAHWPRIALGDREGYFRKEVEVPTCHAPRSEFRALNAEKSGFGEGAVVLDFSTKGNARRVASVTGLSDAESWGSWTDADLSRTCTIEFAEPLPKEFELELCLGAFGKNLGAPFVLRVGAFETSLAVTEQGSTIRTLVPIDGPVRVIEIVPPFPSSPAQAGHGDDRRRLGIGLRSLTIRPLGGCAGSGNGT